MKRIHIIACGGAVMHNIAIALHLLGNNVSGSDDEIFEPALSRLKKYDLAPKTFDWKIENITVDIDFIILGMHARADNPELNKALDLGIKIYSFPDYVYEHAKDKKRIVIGGSHGKTSTTAMIMHVLKALNFEFDYLVGSQLEGFETMVKFSDAPVMIIEGDEYLTSALDPVPKFLKYKPHYAVLTGISWDHINVFPTFENYLLQFQLFVESINKDGVLAYFEQDEHIVSMLNHAQCKTIGYNTPQYHIRNNKVVLSKDERYELNVFGEHNLQNIEAAKLMCLQIGVAENDFYNAIKSFTGTAKRLEKVFESEKLTIFRDFAHSPSKLKATVDAVRNQYPSHYIFSVYELHTFSSLKKEFLPHYKNTMQASDENIVYFNPEVIQHKKLEPILEAEIEKNFGDKTVAISSSNLLSEKISKFKSNFSLKPCVLLLMSSGNFDNLQLW